MPIRLAFLFVLLTQSLWGDFRVGVISTESFPSKSLVKLKTRNEFDQGVKGARVWVFLMDDQGRVVGQHAQWIIGNETNQPQASDKNGSSGLEAGNEAEFSILVKHESDKACAPTQTKVTFSRIILADGTVVNAQKSVKPFED